MELENNSNEMKTQVETFVIEETSELIYDDEQLTKWNELVDELGLQGQTEIVKKDKSPIPFMYLKNGMVNVFSTLCPVSVKAEEYNLTPIPLEILELIALSRREGYFDEVQIWYDDKSPDPVCVGINADYYAYKDGKSTPYFNTRDEAKKASDNGNGYVYEANRKTYLIGKWADVKHSFSELKEMAVKRYTAERKAICNSYIKQYKRELDDLESEAFNKFN